ncbi:hypothetical protein [Rhodococcus sp. WB9]|uniref:hypothetical protein n=1 Tax=Rhodococcus sp. WB9 TaxID=2594007 RepID=UPI001642BD26|nr:hypothetical protein [Rhodococcus sp. WB9]
MTLSRASSPLSLPSDAAIGRAFVDELLDPLREFRDGLRLDEHDLSAAPMVRCSR